MSKKAAFIYLNPYCETVFYGGGAKVNFYIIKGLIKDGYAVDIYCPKSNVEKSTIANNLFVIEKNFKETVENLSEKYDLVLSVNLNYPANITYVHDHTYIELSKKVRNFFTNFFYKIFFAKKHFIKMNKHKIAKKNVRIIDKVVVSSKELYNDYLLNMKIPPQKLFILPPGVDIPPQNNKETIIKNDTVIFGINAKGFRNKGGYLVLNAINKLKNKYKNFKVIIINQNAHKNLMIKFLLRLYNIQNFVEFLPLQDNMYNFYSSIDFLLVPSLKEPYGMVTSEAMAYKKPAIVSAISGSSDLIKDGQNGFIVNFSSNRVFNLYEKMDKAMILSNKDYNIMAMNAYNTVKEMTWDNFSEKYIQILKAK